MEDSSGVGMPDKRPGSIDPHALPREKVVRAGLDLERSSGRDRVRESEEEAPQWKQYNSKTQEGPNAPIRDPSTQLAKLPVNCPKFRQRQALGSGGRRSPLPVLESAQPLLALESA